MDPQNTPNYAPPALPEDVYYLVLSRLDDAQALARCLQTCTQLNHAASSSSLWEPLYHARYKHCLRFNEDYRREACQNNYHLMYAYRRRMDAAALKLLHLVVTNRVTRLQNAEKLAGMGWDVWDVLQLEASGPIPGIFMGSTDTDDDASSDSLTRRFWAENILGVISRRSAAQTTWSRTFSDDPMLDQDGSLVEDALSSISAFFGQSTFLIKKYFDELAERCRKHIETAGYALTPLDTNAKLGRVCTLICDFMRSEGYGPMQSRPLSARQLFPHSYISDTRRTIPICLCHVFVAITRRLGIPARAVAFPSRVIVRIASPPGSEDFFVDVYDSERKALLSLRDDIPQLLQRAGVPPNSAASYITPANASVLLNRAVQNIFNARDEAISSLSDGPADYAALCIIIMSGEGMNAQLIRYMMSCINVPALDSKAFLIPVFAQLLLPNVRSFLVSVCEDSIREEQDLARSVKRRAQGETKVKYKVGTFFKHRKYDYFGLIYSWDPMCHASSTWITQMGVNNLSRGASQPFYNSFTTRSGSTYVAEENMEPTAVNPAVVRIMYTKYPNFARWFCGIDEIDEGGVCKMAPSPEMKEMYPEDFA